MATNAQVQYIRYGIDGTTARKLQAAPAPYKAAAMPKQHKRKCIYIDPVAIFGITVALCMFIAMSVGLVRFAKQQKQVDAMQAYVDQLTAQNDTLEQQYLDSYDAEEVKHTAMALGMVHKADIQTVNMEVTMPAEQEAPVTLMERLGTFLTSLFA